MQENHVPNASIPPSNQPTNAPEQKKSNTGLIIAIVALVVAFLLQFAFPFIFVFLSVPSFEAFFEDFVEELEGSYEDDAYNGSSSYIGTWKSGSILLTFDHEGSYLALDGEQETTGAVEAGTYSALSGYTALKKLNFTEQQAAEIFKREGNFDANDFYLLTLTPSAKEDAAADQTTAQHTLLIYHLNYYNLEVYDSDSKEVYDFTWYLEDRANQPTDEDQPSATPSNRT